MAHDFAHRLDFGVGRDPGDVAHDHPADRRMAEIDFHVGDRAAAVPGEELGHRAPRPILRDGAVERRELGRALRALRLGDGRRGEAVDAADAFGDAAQDRELVGERQPAGAERRAAESAVIVGLSTKPGASARPFASITRSAVRACERPTAPGAATTSSSIRTSPRKAACVRRR